MNANVGCIMLHPQRECSTCKAQGQGVTEGGLVAVGSRARPLKLHSRSDKAPSSLINVPLSSTVPVVLLGPTEKFATVPARSFKTTAVPHSVSPIRADLGGFFPPFWKSSPW